MTKTINEILTTVTHDLRQPLQAMLLYLDALDRRTEREDARDILGKARMAANAMSEHLNALSLHGKLQRGDVVPCFEPVAAGDIAVRALKGAPKNAIALSVPDPEGTFDADAALLTQALRAMTENALRHGRGAASFEIKADGESTLFIVRDSGPGIAAADRARIFEPFVKLEVGGEGLGLGLSNAAGLAALLGAKIDIEDANEGAVFTLRLPSSAQ